jgi:hypothetical protein
MTIKHVTLVAAALIVAASSAWAQTAAATGPLDTILVPGTTVWITDLNGREERGRIISLSGGLVTVSDGEDVRRLRDSDIARVRVKHSDSLLNGALIGAGAAVGSGLFLCRLSEPWENCRDDVGPMLRIGAVGAAIGIGIDAAIRGRRTVYEAPGAARLDAMPIVGRRVAGLQIAVTF